MTGDYRGNYLLQGATKFVWVSTFVVALIANYHFLANNYFAALGIEYYALGPGQILFIVVVLGGASIVLPSRIDRATEFVAHLLFLILVCPTAVIAMSSSEELRADTAVLVVVFVLAVLTLFLFSHLPRIRFPKFQATGRQVVFTLLALYFLSFGILFASFGFSMPTSVLDVYGVRLQAREVFESGLPGLGYVVRWTANALNPGIFLVGILRRKPSLVMLAIFGQIAIYSFDATKVTLFSLFFVFGTWFLVKKAKCRSWALYAAGTALLGLMPMLDYLIGYEVLNFLFVRRIFYMPAVASVIYQDVFMMSDAFFWSGSFLGSIVDKPVDYSSPAFFVGSVRFGSDAVSANANFLSAAYANAGYIGVAIMVLLAGLFFWLYDSLSCRSGVVVALPLVAIPAFSLSNSALPSVLLTHGLIPCLALAYFVGSASNRTG